MDIHPIVSWNIRGASNDTIRFLVKTIILETKARLVCLQETKSQNWYEKNIRSLGMGKNVGWREAPSLGLSRGPPTVWDNDVLSITESKVTRHSIGIKGVCHRTKSQFVCINVYAL